MQIVCQLSRDYASDLYSNNSHKCPSKHPLSLRRPCHAFPVALRHFGAVRSVKMRGMKKRGMEKRGMEKRGMKKRGLRPARKRGMKKRGLRAARHGEARPPRRAIMSAFQQ